MCASFRYLPWPFVLVLFLSACAGSRQELVSKPEPGEAAGSEEIESLKRALEASYDREQAMAERLHLAEESDAQLREQLETLRRRVAALDTRLDSLSARASVPPAAPEVFRTKRFDVLQKYQKALRDYRDFHYERALGQFAEIISMVPYSDRADNAQYWIGECYYGLGKYRQALTEFTKVFAYRKTDKADDAQLKIARSYLSLGEKDHAIAAFQKLLDEYPDSEYLAAARKEIKYLSGP